MKTFLFAFALLFISCNKVWHLADVKDNSYQLDGKNAETDSSVADLIAPYKKTIEQKTNEVIGESAITMVKAKPQSTLGNWIADLVHKKSEDYYKYNQVYN